MELVEALRAAGLGGRLADVYLALLRAGSASVLELAAQSGLKRTTVYDLLARLQERQLVTTGSRGRRRVFSARDPGHLRELPLEQARILEETIPLLHALQQAAPRRPRIQLYEGAEGVRKANDLLLELPITEYHYFGSLRAMMELLGEKYLYGFVKRRMARGVWSNGIRSPDGELRHDFLRPGNERLRRIRYFPSPLGPDVPALYIAGSHLVVSSSLREAYALVIESPGLAELVRAIWQVVWAVSDVRPGVARGATGVSPHRDVGE